MHNRMVTKMNRKLRLSVLRLHPQIHLDRTRTITTSLCRTVRAHTWHPLSRCAWWDTERPCGCLERRLTGQVSTRFQHCCKRIHRLRMCQRSVTWPVTLPPQHSSAFCDECQEKALRKLQCRPPIRAVKSSRRRLSLPTERADFILYPFHVFTRATGWRLPEIVQTARLGEAVRLL